jgi:hypothetical protein
MNVDPYLRRSAASQLIDALVAMDLEHAGEEQTDQAILLALGPMADALSNDVHLRATLAAALDLLWFLTYKQAQQSGSDREVLLGNLREQLEQLFPVPGDPNYS